MSLRWIDLCSPATNEQRIAGHVAEGKTNKDVAAALFVTDRTVESTLTQIYGSSTFARERN